MLAVVLWLCLGLALPLLLSLYSSNLASDAVEAAPGDAFSLSQAVTLADAPAVRVERGTIAFVDAGGSILPAQRGEGAAAPATGLRLFNATITIGATSDAAPDVQSAAPLSPFVEALIAGRYETLSLRRTTVVVHRVLDQPETLTDVKAEVSLRRRGLISIKGTGLLRGHLVTLDSAINVGQAERNGTALHRVPLKLSLKGEPLELMLDGRMVLSPEAMELQGQGEVSLPSGRGLARWLGAYWPAGPGLRDLTVRGQLQLSRQTLTFENAVVRMDGNEATGVVGLRLGHPRPVLTGTLAYKSFDASAYLSGTAADTTSPFSWSALVAGQLTVPLGMHLDADLRMSADRVLLGPLELGRVAATVALKDGRVLADIADLKLSGGEGGGQITADFTGFTPRVTVRGRLDDVELGQVSKPQHGSPLLLGRGGIVADLTGAGSTIEEVMWGLAGKLTVRAQSQGRLGLDLRGLATAAREPDGVVGWETARKGATLYDGLDLRLVLRDGTVLTETVEMRTPDGVWTATGVVNLFADRIDLRISRALPAAGAGTALSPPQLAIQLHGPLGGPSIKAEPSP